MRHQVLLLSIATAGLCTGCAAVAIAGLAEPAGAVPQADMVYAAALVPLRDAPLEPALSGRWRRASDGLFYITARVNGVNVRFLVDTGASVTVLTEQDAARAGAVRIGRPATIATVGGVTPMQWASVDQLAVGTKQIDSVSVAIVPQSNGVSLLGQNVLRQLSQVSIRGDELVIG